MSPIFLDVGLLELYPLCLRVHPTALRFELHSSLRHKPPQLAILTNGGVGGSRGKRVGGGRGGKVSGDGGSGGGGGRPGVGVGVGVQ